MMFNTYTMSDNSRYSPGLILMRDIVDHYASAAIARSTSGSDRTTTRGCSARATSRSSTASFRSARAASRGGRDVRDQPRQDLVKHNPALFQLAQKLRSALHRSS